MKYSECIEYLEELNQKGIKPGPDAEKNLLKALGNPERDLKIVHIAGTNGKGSVGSYIKNVLKEAGYKAGHYRTPAVFDLRDIITVGDRMISQSDYVNLIEEIKATGLEFTRFECETALAFLYFKRKSCEFAVIECGLGGRDDATNAVDDTFLSVITSVGRDHMRFLGNTVAEIAANKAGIVRQNGTIVYIKSGNGADEAIEEAAASKTAESIRVNPSEIKNAVYGIDGAAFDYKEYAGIEISMAGEHQALNASCAIEAVNALRKKGVSISDKALRNGLHKAKEHGRFELICNKPEIILDGAHNEPASLAFARNTARLLGDKKLIFIFGMLKDKEYDKVIRNTCDMAEHIITVPSPNRDRALSSFELADEVRKVNPNVTAADSVEEGTELALLMADKDTAIVAFGSFTILKPVTDYLKKVGKI